MDWAVEMGSAVEVAVRAVTMEAMWVVGQEETMEVVAMAEKTVGVAMVVGPLVEGPVGAAVTAAAAVAEWEAAEGVRVALLEVGLSEVGRVVAMADAAEGVRRVTVVALDEVMAMEVRMEAVG